MPHALGLGQVVLQLRLGGRPASDEVQELRVAGVTETRLAAELNLGHHGPLRAEGEVELLADLTLLGLLLVLGVAVLAAALPRAGPALPLDVPTDGWQLSVIAYQHDEHLSGDGSQSLGRAQGRGAQAAGQEQGRWDAPTRPPWPFAHNPPIPTTSVAACPLRLPHARGGLPHPHHVKPH